MLALVYQILHTIPWSNPFSLPGKMLMLQDPAKVFPFDKVSVTPASELHSFCDSTVPFTYFYYSIV